MGTSGAGGVSGHLSSPPDTLCLQNAPKTAPFLPFPRDHRSLSGPRRRQQPRKWFSLCSFPLASRILSQKHFKTLYSALLAQKLSAAPHFIRTKSDLSARPRALRDRALPLPLAFQLPLPWWAPLQPRGLFPCSSHTLRSAPHRTSASPVPSAWCTVLQELHPSGSVLPSRFQGP